MEKQVKCHVCRGTGIRKTGFDSKDDCITCKGTGFIDAEKKVIPDCSNFKKQTEKEK